MRAGCWVLVVSVRSMVAWQIRTGLAKLGTTAGVMMLLARIDAAALGALRFVLLQ